MAKMKHVVLLQFKPGVSGTQIDTVFGDLAGLQEKIEGIP